MTEIIYDDLAPMYDERYTDEESQAENLLVLDRVRTLCGIYTEPELLDVGAGTGLALDLKMTHPNRYTGIDPSKGMLQRLLRKHRMAKRVVESTFEEYLDQGQVQEGLQVVLSLFGSPSYIHPEYIEPLFRLAPRAMLMHYREGYWPDYEAKPETMDKSREEAVRVCTEMGGEVFDLNNFKITVVGP